MPDFAFLQQICVLKGIWPCISWDCAQAANLAGYKSIPMSMARQIGWLINVKVDFEPNSKVQL